MALTADYQYETDGHTFGRITAKGKSPRKFWKGAVVQLDNTGKFDIPSDATTLWPVFGVVTKTVDCATAELPVDVEQCAFWAPISGAQQSDVGRYLYATSGNTFSWTSTNSGPCGIVEAFKPGYLLVNLYRACSRTGAV